MVESNLQLEHEDDGHRQSQTEKQENKRADEGIEDKLGEVRHEFCDEVNADTRVEFSAKLEAE